MDRVISAVVLGARIGKFAGGCGGFLIGAALLGAFQKLRPEGFSTLSWAITYGTLLHTTSRAIFVAKQAKKRFVLPAIGVSTVLVTAAIVVGGGMQRCRLLPRQCSILVDHGGVASVVPL
jgi:hypothetical protein